MSSREGSSLKNEWIQDVHHNNSNKLEYTFVKLSETSNILSRKLLMLSSNSLNFTVLSLWRPKERKNGFVINEICKLISIKSLILRLGHRNLMLSVNFAMLK